MEEARLVQTPAGVVPASDGWFSLNLSEIAWETLPGGGTRPTRRVRRTPADRR